MSCQRWFITLRNFLIVFKCASFTEEVTSSRVRQDCCEHICVKKREIFSVFPSAFLSLVCRTSLSCSFKWMEQISVLCVVVGFVSLGRAVSPKKVCCSTVQKTASESILSLQGIVSLWAEVNCWSDIWPTRYGTSTTARPRNSTKQKPNFPA